MRAPTLLAMPALALASWITTGTAGVDARRQVGGQRDVAAESDDDVGVDVVEHGAGLPTARRTRIGSRSRSPVGLRGSGTGVISSRS